MSDCGHEECRQPRGSLCGGTNVRYVVRVRYSGVRRYDAVGKPTRSYRAAFRRLARAFENQNYKRGDVLMTADYYDPVQIVEMTR